MNVCKTANPTHRQLAGIAVAKRVITKAQCQPARATAGRPARFVGLCLCVIFMGLANFVHGQEPDSRRADNGPNNSRRLRILVMDPLAAPLACACVNGVGQRDYLKLGKAIGAAMNRPVEVKFEESLAMAFQRFGRDFDLIVGKKSLVLFDAQQVKVQVRALAQLSDRTGSTHLQGLLVVPRDSPVRRTSELRGRRIVLGPEEDEETHAAGRRLLRKYDAKLAEKLEATGSIDAAVFAVTDGEADAAFVSDFLLPLLEGCGKIAKDSLRVIDKTAEVPFITVFATRRLTPQVEEVVRTVLGRLSRDADLLEAIESKRGFVAIRETKPGDNQPATRSAASDSSNGNSAVVTESSETKTAVTARLAEWPDWRGAQRDGQCSTLPKKLPSSPKIIWSAKLTGPALAGVAVAGSYVVVPDKDADLKRDIFRCFHAETGAELWSLEYAAEKEIDYTNAPRATPVIVDGLAYLQGAVGDLHCVELKTGQVVWKTNIVADFNAEPLTWGASSPPLVVGELLVTNPGAKTASLAALNRKTGKVVWQTPGHAAAYSAFLCIERAGGKQIVGYDVAGLGGWDLQSGKRLWEVVPPDRTDFNVGTPIVYQDKLLVATENNGTRLYRFDDKGLLNKQPVAQNLDATPDTCTPVVLGARMFCTAYGRLQCLDLKNELATIWEMDDDKFYDHTNLIAGNNRVLIWNTVGDLILIRADSPEYEVVSHVRPFGKTKVESMSHPAIVGDRLYVRSDVGLLCLSLKQEKK